MDARTGLLFHDGGLIMKSAFILRPRLTGHRILLLSNLNLLPTPLIHSLFLIYKTHQILGFGCRDLEIISWGSLELIPILILILLLGFSLGNLYINIIRLGIQSRIGIWIVLGYLFLSATGLL